MVMDAFGIKNGVVYHLTKVDLQSDPTPLLAELSGGDNRDALLIVGTLFRWKGNRVVKIELESPNGFPIISKPEGEKGRL